MSNDFQHLMIFANAGKFTNGHHTLSKQAHAEKRALLPGDQ